MTKAQAKLDGRDLADFRRRAAARGALLAYRLISGGFLVIERRTLPVLALMLAKHRGRTRRLHRRSPPP